MTKDDTGIVTHKRLAIPKGFQAAGISCGLKKSGKKDLALIYSEVPATAAAVFTTNQVKAAPILVSQKQIKSGIAQAMVVNSGNANCWTGLQGIKDAKLMIQSAAKTFHISEKYILVASTGTIGAFLPREKVAGGIKRASQNLSHSRKNFLDAAAAILTTDTRLKIISQKVGPITILGLAKGSGMIAPRLAGATMLAFILTDAKIDRKSLQKVFKQSVNKSFNLISVDNCMSTNDCVFALANGLSGLPVSRFRLPVFVKAFEKVCIYLAKEIARDGEGATKLLEVRVEKGRSVEEAKRAAKALVNSFLLKAAVYGKDKNFGRILQTLGAINVKVNWKRFKWEWQMGKKEDVITVNLGGGKFSAVAWGCDLSEGYVRINARYRT